MRNFYFGLALLLAGCELLGSSPQAIYSTNPIDFSNLKVGQQSYYLPFNAQHLFLNKPSYTYHNSILSVKVIEQADSEFTFQESWLPDPDIDPSLVDPAPPVHYKVQVKDDSLHITLIPSQVFSLESSIFQTTDIPIPIQPLNNSKLELDGVIISEPGDKDIEAGYIENHQQLGGYYPHLNLFIDSRSPILDHPEYVLVYSSEKGVVRSFSLSTRSGTANGYDLITRPYVRTSSSKSISWE